MPPKKNTAAGKNASLSESEGEDVRAAILRESLKILRSEGIGGLSIRKVAANLGLSHGAPYRHYPTREHILAALTETAFSLFAASLSTNLNPIYETEKLTQRLLVMCENYYRFAFESADYYRFMFGPPLFDFAAFPEVQKKADLSFGILVEQVAAMIHAGLVIKTDPIAVSMFIFSTMHGSASLMLNGATEHLVADHETRSRLALFLQERILTAIANSAPQSA